LEKDQHLKYYTSPQTAAAATFLPSEQSNQVLVVALVFSGGGTCRNRALGDTFLKFGMAVEQAMRFSKTTGYKLTHAAGGCSCKKKRPKTDIKYAMHRLLWIVASSIIPILCYFEYGECLLMLYAQCHSNRSSTTAIISL